jgi:hypothetical protein
MAGCTKFELEFSAMIEVKRRIEKDKKRGKMAEESAVTVCN